MTEFAYAVEADVGELDEYEVMSTTIPLGMAVLDTGCTASVIGESTARQYRDFFVPRGLPEGSDVDHALCGYRPRFERIPKAAATTHTTPVLLPWIPPVTLKLRTGSYVPPLPGEHRAVRRACFAAGK